jgi:hypothetical protein
MTRQTLIRHRSEILRKAAVVGSILAGGLMWAYTMALMTGSELLPKLRLDGVLPAL